MYLTFISTMEYNCDKLKEEKRNKHLFFNNNLLSRKKGLPNDDTLT
jgi:hypothetical protein